MSEKDPSVSDEEWAAFVEAARKDGVGVGPAPKARRRRFGRREAASQGQPEGWRTGPAWQEMKGRSKARRQVKGVVGITLAAGLLLLALRPDLITDRLPVGLGGAEDTPLAAETARPTEAPAREMLPDRPTPEEPFKGSPALRWADGAAGIQVPQAAAVGWMSKDQVAAALKRTKEFLVAANLDPAVIQGGKPEAALRLLDPQQSDLRPRLEKALATPTAENDPTHVFSRFDPAEVRLVGSVVKTRGRMTVEKGTGKDAGTVLIHTDYTFVYPVVKTRPGFDAVERTIVRRVITFSLADPARYRVSRGTLGVNSWDTNVGNSECESSEDGYFHPTFAEDRSAAPVPTESGPLVDPYDRSKSPDDLPHECGTVSRS